MSLQSVATQFLSTIESSIASNRNTLSTLSPAEISHKATFIDALESCAKLFNTIAAPFLNSTPEGAIAEDVISTVIDSTQDAAPSAEPSSNETPSA